MAVTVKTGGIFTIDPGQRPGLYARFIQKAIASIGVGARSKVGMVKVNITGGTATAGQVYKVDSMDEADALFGSANTADIGMIFKGGASQVIVSTVSAAADAAAYNNALNLLETFEFHVFTVGYGSADVLDTAAFTWLKNCRTNGKNFIAVFADEATEGNLTTMKTKALTFDDEYSVFVGGGVKDGTGAAISADKYATFIAGLIAGTPLDGSLTYMDVPFAETITRWRSSDIKDMLAAGILVTVMDGDAPRIEQGLTLGDAPFNKIRTVRAKQAMIDDIDRAVSDNYIGKITNNEDGQIGVVNAIKAYLETLANANVIADDFSVAIDKTVPSINADLYINLSVRFLDSIEYIYLTVTV